MAQCTKCGTNTCSCNLIDGVCAACREVITVYVDTNGTLTEDQ